ncbi:hypothetical protein EV368DRAFT_2173, partial [Lentinula lateritia]
FHERFGHPGIDLTNELLTGNSAQGLEEWNGTKMRGICDSCLKGKHPRFPYPYHGNRASKPLELIHTDTCGPIGTLSNHQSSHFNIILDDYTSALSGHCFAKKNQA